MRAWQVVGAGEPSDAMRQSDVAVPAPGDGEVLVGAWATCLGFSDVLLVRGEYPDQPEPPFTPGAEVCGEIVAIGAGVERGRLGDRVIGRTRMPHGGLASYCLARDTDMLPAPKSLDDATAAAFHTAYQVGWFGLYRRAALRVGETLLVNAAAGGLGSAAVQLGRAAGARVIGVVGSPGKVEVARSVGADQVIDRSQADVVEAVREATGGKGVDVAYDPVGAEVYDATAQVVAPEGRLVVVGFAGGRSPSLGLDHVRNGNYALLGVNWIMYATHRPDLIRRAHEELTTLAGAGALAPLVSRRLPFADAARGLAELASGTSVGRTTVAAP